MCGILYAKGKDAPLKVLRQYREQRNRGSNGFGWLSIGKKVERRRYEGELMAMFQLGKISSNEIIFHHRIPTSTENSKKTNHPIANTCDYKRNYYLVHNGIISNEKTLYNAHKELGLSYETESTDGKSVNFNDSECLLHELALVLEGRKQTVDIEGSAAFILGVTDKKGNYLRTYFGRNSGNPLRVNEDFSMIASELEEGRDVETDKLFCINRNSSITVKELKIGKVSTVAYCGGSYGGYHGDMYDDDYPMGYRLNYGKKRRKSKIHSTSSSNQEIQNYKKALINAWSTSDVAKLEQIKTEIPSLEQKHARNFIDHEKWKEVEMEAESYILALTYHD